MPKNCNSSNYNIGYYLRIWHGLYYVFLVYCLSYTISLQTTHIVVIYYTLFLAHNKFLCLMMFKGCFVVLACALQMYIQESQ